MGQLIEAPEPPAGLGTVGQDYWRKLTTTLARSRGLTENILHMIEALCGQWELHCRWRWYLLQNLDKWTITTKNGYRVESPEVRFMKGSLAECERLWKLLKLTPEKHANKDFGGLAAVAAMKTIGDEENMPDGAKEARR